MRKVFLYILLSHTDFFRKKTDFIARPEWHVWKPTVIALGMNHFDTNLPVYRPYKMNPKTTTTKKNK